MWHAAALAPTGPHINALRALGSAGVGMHGRAQRAAFATTRAHCVAHLRRQFTLREETLYSEERERARAHTTPRDAGLATKRHAGGSPEEAAEEAQWSGAAALSLLSCCAQWTALHFAIDARDIARVVCLLQTRHTVVDELALAVARASVYPGARAADDTLCTIVERARSWSPLSHSLFPAEERALVVTMHLLWLRLPATLNIDLMMWWHVVGLAVTRV